MTHAHGLRILFLSAKAYLVFELVGILVLFLVQVNEVVRDSLLGSGIHVPTDLERVTCDVADFDMLRHRKFFHLSNPAVLGLVPCWKDRCDKYHWMIGYRTKTQWKTTTT